MAINRVEFEAFGKRIVRYTILNVDSVSESLKEICPTAHSLVYTPNIMFITYEGIKFPLYSSFEIIPRPRKNGRSQIKRTPLYFPSYKKHLQFIDKTFTNERFQFDENIFNAGDNIFFEDEINQINVRIEKAASWYKEKQLLIKSKKNVA